MGYVHAIVLLMVSVAGADGEQKKDAELGTIDAANRTVRLVGGVIGRTPARKLGAKFVEIEPTSGRDFAVSFPSRGHTTHEVTLMNIIRSAVQFGQEPHKLHEPQFEVIFSIPKDARGDARDVDRWYLASIKPLEAKKEPPEDAVNAMPGDGERPIIAGPQDRVVQLVGVRFSDGRQRDLLAKFAEFAPQSGFDSRQEVGEIELGMGSPIASTRDQAIADVTHTRTILNIIKSSVSSPPIPNPRIDETQWRKPQFEVIFSIPQNAQGNVTDFTRWSLLSIELPNAKKEQAKPSDK